MCTRESRFRECGVEGGCGFVKNFRGRGEGAIEAQYISKIQTIMNYYRNARKCYVDVEEKFFVQIFAHPFHIAAKPMLKPRHFGEKTIFSFPYIFKQMFHNILS